MLDMRPVRADDVGRIHAAAVAVVPRIVVVAVEPEAAARGAVAGATGCEEECQSHRAQRPHRSGSTRVTQFTMPIVPPSGSAMTAMLRSSRSARGATTTLPPAATARRIVSPTSLTSTQGIQSGPLL